LVLDFTTDGPSSHPDCLTSENNRPTTVGIVRHFQRSVHHLKIYVQYGKKFVRYGRKNKRHPEKTSITAGKMSIIAPGVRHSNGAWTGCGPMPRENLVTNVSHSFVDFIVAIPYNRLCVKYGSLCVHVYPPILLLLAGVVPRNPQLLGRRYMKTKWR
jgi:hypothetical protein